MLVAAESRDVEHALSYFDGQLRQRIKFPNPFRGELGLTTNRGIASYRAIHALYQARRTLELLKAHHGTSVIEIGPGMGRGAYYAHQAGITNYTTIDLPLGVVRQACFLGTTLGPDNIWIEGEDPDLASGRVNLLFADRPPERHFDVAVNVDSMTEMPVDIAFDYLTWIAEHCSVFFSINHDICVATVAEVAAYALDPKRVEGYPYRLRERYFEETFLLGRARHPALLAWRRRQLSTVVFFRRVRRRLRNLTTSHAGSHRV